MQGTQAQNIQAGETGGGFRLRQFSANGKCCPSRSLNTSHSSEERRSIEAAAACWATIASE